jgi:hypothetical protein
MSFNSDSILIFCPTARLEPETVRAIFDQDYTGPCDVMFTLDNPYGHATLDDDYDNILHNYRKMRRMMLAGDYQAVWCVESDILPPRDALRKLLAVDGDTVGGLYALRNGKPHPANVFSLGAEPGIDRWMDWDEIARRWGQVIETGGTCLGCVLIRREVLEQVDFRSAKPCACDTGLMQDLYRLGKRQMCDLSVVCGHKQPDGMILWATPQGVRYEKTAPSFWEIS